MAQTGSWLQIRHLSVDIAGLPVLRDFSCDLPSGVQLITGDEGSGKTTLAKVLSGSVPASKGSVVLNGSVIPLGRPHLSALDAHAVVDARRDAETGDAVWQCVRTQWTRFNDGAMEDLIAAFDLKPHMAKPLFQWSTGSRRKLGLCAAFAAGAELAVLDVPYAALDARSAAVLDDVLSDLMDHPRRCWLILDYEPPPGLGILPAACLSSD